MTIKYVTMKLEEVPDYNSKEFGALPPQEQQRLLVASARNMHKRLFMLAMGVIQYGDHESDCNEEGKCSCGYDGMLVLAGSVVDSVDETMFENAHTVN